MTGHVRTEVERDYGSADSAPGVEPLEELIVRAEQAFDELVRDHGPGPLGHLDPALADVRQPTACWNVLSRIGDRWRVDAYDLITD